jgi:two-component system response regulator FlrC
MKESARILVVEDEASLRALYNDILAAEGHAVEAVGTLEEGLRRFDADLWDVVLTDLRLPDGEGTRLLAHAKARDPDVEVLLITAYGTIASAVQAMRAGAADYLTKPLGSPDDLRRAIRGCVDRARERRDASAARVALKERGAGAELVAESPAFREALRLAEAVAPTGATVLLLGESGTGKEVLARAIHRLHRGASAPFVAVNCAAIPETLLESEMFGHERGAFTGATERRTGRLERAAGGTLFLDEIGDLRADLQAKMLRVLQERSFERVGGSASLKLEARLIAATNRDLQAEVRAGRFREDLYFRLAVFPIHLPPLRERPEDVVPLALRFLLDAAARFGRPVRQLSPEARARLLSHPFPGNVRELQNLIERAVILESGDTLSSRSLRLDLPGSDAAQAAGEEGGLLDTLERETILRVLGEAGGNRRRAARILGISLRTLQYRLRDYGITSE